MSALVREANIPDPDGFYEELVGCLKGLDDAQAERFQAKLLLVLANHVGDREVLREAMAVARRGLGPAGDRGEPPGGRSGPAGD